jgi:hypothetical protein
MKRINYTHKNQYTDLFGYILWCNVICFCVYECLLYTCSGITLTNIHTQLYIDIQGKRKIIYFFLLRNCICCLSGLQVFVRFACVCLILVPFVFVNSKSCICMEKNKRKSCLHLEYKLHTREIARIMTNMPDLESSGSIFADFYLLSQLI